MMTNQFTSFAAHFEDLADAPEQYRWHCPMRHVQGYSGSHWTPASGNYLLCIAPAAARATGKQTTSTNAPKKVAVLMAMAMRQCVTVHIARFRRFMALEDATKRYHQASIAANCCNLSCMCRLSMSFFILNSHKKVAGQC
jgi:hypothetical protein